MSFPKALIKKLSFMKNNSSLLLPIIIGLVGIVLLVPMYLMSSGLKKQIKSESVSNRGAKIRSLDKDVVPSEQWKKEAERQKDYASDANRIALLAKQSTQRELLSYKIFPEPQNKSQFTFKEFGERYYTGLESLLRRVNARDCPTEAELNRAFEKSPTSTRVGSVYRSIDAPMTRTGPRRGPTAPLYGGGALSDVQQTIEDEICLDRATSISVYANPVDLSGYEYWKEYKYESQVKDAVEDCWYYQLSYWVIEDIIDTIAVMNTGSDSVLTSPVKRFMSVNFNLGVSGLSAGSLYGSRGPYAMSDRTKSKKDDRPIYATSPQVTLIEPCTGRYCDDNIDVIHFNFVVIVRTKSVLPFMQELCSAKEHKFAGFSGDKQAEILKHNQITVLESKMRSISRDDPLHSLYRYGEDAVVELDLVCEYIFSKAGYKDIKPPSIEEAKNQTSKTQR